MQRVTRSTAVAVMPAIPASPGSPGYFSGGDPVSNTPATVPGYEWHNGVQEELISAITDANLTPSASVLTQLRQAIRRLCGGYTSTLAVNTTLTADHAGMVVINVAAARTLTLPAANAIAGSPIRFEFVRTDTTAFTVTVQRAGTDTVEGVNNITIPVGGRVVLVSDGVSAWRVMSGLLGRQQVFSANGTFTPPAGVYRVRVTVVGGGGGGAGGDTARAGSGGGAGGAAIGWVDVTPGTGVAVTVGAGGATASGAAAASAGGTSSFGSLASATGGNGGTAANGTNNAGAAGGAGTITGGAAITGAYGTDGYFFSSTVQFGGTGGGSVLGGAGRPAVNGNSGANMAGQAPGSGGSGAYLCTGTVAGGVGAAGIVIVEW